MATNPEQRLSRLVRNALRGWTRARASAEVRERAAEWLRQHPSAMRAVDALWLAALDGEGPLAAWLDAGADPQQWPGEPPLHSVLACHPFPDQPQWTELRK